MLPLLKPQSKSKILNVPSFILLFAFLTLCFFTTPALAANFEVYPKCHGRPKTTNSKPNLAALVFRWDRISAAQRYLIKENGITIATIDQPANNAKPRYVLNITAGSASQYTTLRNYTIEYVDSSNATISSGLTQNNNSLLTSIIANPSRIYDPWCGNSSPISDDQDNVGHSVGMTLENFDIAFENPGYVSKYKTKMKTGSLDVVGLTCPTCSDASTIRIRVSNGVDSEIMAFRAITASTCSSITTCQTQHCSSGAGIDCSTDNPQNCSLIGDSTFDNNTCACSTPTTTTCSLGCSSTTNTCCTEKSNVIEGLDCTNLDGSPKTGSISCGSSQAYPGQGCRTITYNESGCSEVKRVEDTFPCCMPTNFDIWNNKHKGGDSYSPYAYQNNADTNTKICKLLGFPSAIRGTYQPRDNASWKSWHEDNGFILFNSARNRWERQLGEGTLTEEYWDGSDDDWKADRNWSDDKHWHAIVAPETGIPVENNILGSVYCGCTTTTNSFSCIGTTPANAITCGNDTNLTADRTKTLMQSCDLTKCTYQCAYGYKYQLNTSGVGSCIIDSDSSRCASGGRIVRNTTPYTPANGYSSQVELTVKTSINSKMAYDYIQMTNATTGYATFCIPNEEKIDAVKADQGNPNASYSQGASCNPCDSPDGLRSF